MTIGLQVNGCSRTQKNHFERENKIDLFEVIPHSRRTYCLQDAVIYMSQTKSSPYLQLHVNLKDMLKDPRPVIRIK